MASPLTRSSRRGEGLKTRSNLVVQSSNARNKQPLPAVIERRKRPREESERDSDPIEVKKARITVDIRTRPKALPKSLPKKRSLVIAPNTIPEEKVHRSARSQIAPAQPKPDKSRLPTKHSEKVVNGIKHELDKLQPSEEDKKDEKRKLRSQEGTRFKSELSAYFPDYDVVIGNEPEETHFLNVETPIVIVDSKAPPTSVPSAPPPKPKTRRQPRAKIIQKPIRQFDDNIFNTLYQAQRVDFTFLNRHTNGNLQSDPLADSYYDLAHRRAERLERSIRNSEKGRAQHERDQVMRLLEGLQGHEWLKVMGVSGITESKRKDYEPARSYFIKGCRQILEKFRTWREEEKRRKLEKEKALAEAAAEEAEEEAEAEEEVEEEEGEEEEEEVEAEVEEEEVGEDDEEEEIEEEVEEEEEEEEEEEDVDDDAQSNGDPPDYSDSDHAAARQLHEEAIARSASLATSRQREKHVKVERIDPILEETPKEFKSFFAKPHLRQAAVGRNRRSGRNSAAWGQPLPDLGEKEFDLPEEFRDRETLVANARRRRRTRRESKD